MSNSDRFFKFEPGGCVYLIQDTENGRVKIGQTRVNIKKRLSELQTGASSRLEVLHTIHCDCIACEYFERRLHHMFKINRLHGEWFNLCEEAIDWLSSILSASELYSQPAHL